MAQLSFSKSFTQQESLPDAAIQNATQVMRGGRLHRYNVLEGEISHTSLLENEFKVYQGSTYCLACTSGGYALHIALRSCGLKPGDNILTNGFTLAPVPGAIVNAGGNPLFVEVNQDLTIDLDDLVNKARASHARFLMLSHMRGHIGDMDQISAICKHFDLTLIEDCAHTMGATWDEAKSGSFGKVACFSTQTYKHLNSGEGGFLTTDDEQIMAKAVIHSGSYMLFEQHEAAPDKAVFNQIKLETPNFSGRMDNLRAAILRPQLKELGRNCKRWNDRYLILANKLSQIEGIYLPNRPEKEGFVASSIQFSLPNKSESQILRFITECAKKGVELKWFGAKDPIGFTSRYDSWQYVQQKQHLPKTLHILSTLCDMRIPLTFDHNDCELIGDIIKEVAQSHYSD